MRATNQISRSRDWQENISRMASTTLFEEPRRINQKNLMIFFINMFVMRCAIWYHWHNLKSLKNTYGRMLLLVKLQAKRCTLNNVCSTLNREFNSRGNESLFKSGDKFHIFEFTFLVIYFWPRFPFHAPLKSTRKPKVF